MPKRIQRKRVAGWRLPPNTVIVSRPSRYGNPYWVGSWRTNSTADGHVETVQESVELFRVNIAPYLDLEPLRGKDVACYCAEDAEWCHGDVLLEFAAREVA